MDVFPTPRNVGTASFSSSDAHRSTTDSRTGRSPRVSPLGGVGATTGRAKEDPIESLACSGSSEEDFGRPSPSTPCRDERGVTQQERTETLRSSDNGEGVAVEEVDATASSEAKGMGSAISGAGTGHGCPAVPSRETLGRGSGVERERSGGP